ncbi:hypothetical protein IFR05_007563 [Cadophora sp. M221]|nr:hypothetical protein IFR05_007563 [Cadophora sp. M221]
MAAGKHPVNIPPVRPLYRFAATGLGASMWFFLMYRAKKDGKVLRALHTIRTLILEKGLRYSAGSTHGTIEQFGTNQKLGGVTELSS